MKKGTQLSNDAVDLTYTNKQIVNNTNHPINVNNENQEKEQNENLYISTILCDRDWLIDANKDDNNTTTMVKRCPEIYLTLSGVIAKSLLDTGATLSAINESFYEKHKVKFKKHEILPLTNFYIITATNTKSKRLKKVVYMETVVNDFKFHAQYIVIPNLITDVIIGTDVFNEFKVKIDFDKMLCTFFGENLDKFCIQQYKQLQGKINDNHDNNFDENPQENEICKHKTPCYRSIRFIQNNHNSLQCQIQEARTDEELDYSDQIEEEILTTIKDMVRKIDSVNTSEKEQLEQLLVEFQGIFSDKPGLCNKFEYHIQLKDYTPFKSHYYPVPACYHDQVTEHINKMLEDGIIERSQSGYINSILIVPKKDGSIRLCLDARGINKKILNDYDTNQGINEILGRLKRARFLTTIDLTASYWQIPLSKESRQYTAFQYQGKTYQFTRIPFGINISQAALLRAMELVLADIQENFLQIYIDDLLLFSDSFQEHIKHLRHLFTNLQNSNMTIKLSKSLFCRQEVPYLGYVITTSGIKPDENKILSIKNFPTPRNRKELKGFLGLTNFYNKFFERYGDLTKPLLKLTSKLNKFIWTETEENAFKRVKELFKETLLYHPDINKPFYLQTDCSKISIGGHLYQLDNNGSKNPIMFMSKTLRPYEINYTTTEQECLAIIYCLNKVRHIVLGNHVVIFTDHKALTFLKTCKLLSPRLTRWILSLNEYNYSIYHCSGKSNIVADTLSRIRCDGEDEIYNNEITIAHIQIQISPKFIQTMKDMPQHQYKDENLRNIIQNSYSYDEIKDIPRPIPKYIKHKGLLYKVTKEGYKLVIPDHLAYLIIREVHQYYIHCGMEKCAIIIKEYFTFKHLYKKIRKFISTCISCQKNKHMTHPLYGEATGLKCEKIKDMVSIDFIGPLPLSSYGTRYVFIMTDNYSRHVKLYPIKKANTSTVLNKMFNHYIINYGKPNKILSDNGTQFRSHTYIDKLKENEITPVFIPIRHPKMNISERHIQNVKKCLRTLCSDKQKAWANYIPLVEECLNELPSSTTGCTPNHLQLGITNQRFWYRFLPHLDDQRETFKIKAELALQRIRNRRNKTKDIHNERHKLTSFNVGDYVLIQNNPVSSAIEGVTSKLFNIFSGPYIISEKIGKTVYNVKHPDRNTCIGPYHISLLKKYYHPINIETDM